MFAVGLTLTTATDVVIFAIACMGLNILVGHTGLVSFGHGAFFGLAGYAAALSQRHWFPGDIVIPSLFAIVVVAVFAWLAGSLILRRRGVYFSLLTLALSAMLFAIAFRWTAVTGGESGLGGVVRPMVLGVDLARPWIYYAVVAAIGFLAVFLLWRFHRSPVGHVLVAIRENEQRARFIGYPSDRYKLFAFTASAAITALAGTLAVFNHRFASAEPISVQFSGELLAMVVIGGMRSFLGPALGALFFILFREFLSIWTPNWLLFFGLLFVGFIVFSPTGLVGVAERVFAPFRKREIEAAAMAGREISQGCAPARGAFRPQGARRPGADRARACEKFRRHPRGRERRYRRAGSHPARADRPERRGQDDGVQSGVGNVSARYRLHHGCRAAGRRPQARRHHARRRRPLVPDHQSVRRPVGRGKHPPRRAGAQPQALRLVVVCRRARRR